VNDREIIRRLLEIGAGDGVRDDAVFAAARARLASPDDFDSLDAVARAAYQTACDKGWHRTREAAAAEAASVRLAMLFLATHGYGADDLAPLADVHARLLRAVDLADGVDIPAELALIHEEVSEALQAYRDPRMHPRRCYVSRGDEIVDVTDGMGAAGKPEGLALELVDVLIRVLKLGVAARLPIAAELRRKMAYNAARPARHGGKRL